MAAALILIGGFLMALLSFFFIESRKRTEKNEEKSQKKIESEYEARANGPIDYDIYIMTKGERAFYISIAAGVIYIVGFIFYRSYILSALIIPLAFIYPRFRTKEIIKKRKKDLNLQFKEALYALSSSLSAGKSIEMAFRDALKDIAILYPEEGTYITHEIQYIIRRLDMNETVEDVLLDFARRSHLEDVKNFVDVFVISKRAGGNIVEIIKNTSDVIADKIQINNDIETMLAQKKFEQKLLNIIPMGLILILSLSAKDYIQPVFETIAGRIAMTISIILLAAAYLISERIMDIEV